MIRKITVKTIKNYSTDKEGNPLTGKFGAYYKYGLTCDEYPTKTLYGIGNKALTWNAGEQYDIDLEEKGEWLNFKLPKKEDLATAGIEALEKRVANLEKNRSEFELKIKQAFESFKSDLSLQTTGKFMTDKDYLDMESKNPLDLIKEDETPF